MESIRSETSDWSDPVILIIARETRDIFLQYLQKITTDSATNIQRPIAEVTHQADDTDTVFCDNGYSAQTNTGIAEFNKSLIPVVEDMCESLKKRLNDIQLYSQLSTKVA